MLWPTWRDVKMRLSIVSISKFITVFYLISIVVFVNVAFAKSTRLTKVSTVKSKPAIIKADNIPLGEVLRSIESQSGIKIKFPNELDEFLVTADIESDNWSKALSELLQDYNKIEIWKSRGSLASVNILGNTENFEIPAFETQAKLQTPRNAPSNKDPLAIDLSIEDLKELSQGKFRSPLPGDLFNNPKYKNILQKSGIRKAEDLSNVNKAMRVRREARKQLRILNRKRQDQDD